MGTEKNSIEVRPGDLVCYVPTPLNN